MRYVKFISSILIYSLILFIGCSQESPTNSELLSNKAIVDSKENKVSTPTQLGAVYDGQCTIWFGGQITYAWDTSQTTGSVIYTPGNYAQNHSDAWEDIKAAADQWNYDTGLELFVETSNVSSADIKIFFSSTGGNANVILTNPTGEFGQNVEGIKFGATSTTTYGVRKIAFHEFAHVLGIDHTSTEGNQGRVKCGTTVDPNTAGDTGNFPASAGDIYTLLDALSCMNYDGQTITLIVPPLVEEASHATYPKISWDAISGATSYEVYRRATNTAGTPHGTYTLIATVTGTNYTDTSKAKHGSGPMKKHWYRVKSKNSSGTTHYSNYIGFDVETAASGGGGGV